MIDRLLNEIDTLSAPVVVGLDPQLEFVPKNLLEAAVEEHGESLEAVGEAFLAFNKKIIDAVCDLVPAVKPQIAMYEMYGIPGLCAFEDTVRYAKKKGLLVIGDVKRGDIGSTSAAYAQAHLGTVTIGETKIAPFFEDFATVNPYLGTDGIQPFIDVCKECDKGIFVLVKTSNPSSGEFQDQLIDQRPLYEHVAEHVEQWGADLRKGVYSEVGAVVGATYPQMGAELRKKMPHTFILVPGYGAQGATGADLKGFFDSDNRGAIINSSRGIIAAWKKDTYAKYGQENFDEAARAATIDMIEDIATALGTK